MKRAAALIALLATSCMTMEPKLDRADPAVAPSWPVGSPYVEQAEAGLPAVTYQQIFTDPRLQTLIAQALVNNRDLMTAAANIAAAREQYVIQRAQQFPQLGATAGATVTGNRSNSGSSGGSGSGSGSGSGGGGSSSKVTAQYQAGLQMSRASSSTYSAGCGRLLTPSWSNILPPKPAPGRRGCRSSPISPTRGSTMRRIRACFWSRQQTVDTRAEKCPSHAASARRRDRGAYGSQPGRRDSVPGPGQSRAAAHSGRAGRQRLAAIGRSADRSRPFYPLQSTRPGRPWPSSRPA